MTEQNQQYLHAVEGWLREYQVAFSRELHPSHALIKLPDVPIILDFRTQPYQKPKSVGFQFGVELFLHRPDALKSRLLSITQKTERIFARKTTTVRETKPTAMPFFERNHLAGYAQAKFKYALVFEGEIVAMATFAQGRNFLVQNKNLRSYELIGFCQKNNYTVVGGLSKLIKHFARMHRADHISTTVDLDWATGDAYKKSGFVATQLHSPMSYALHEKTGKRAFPPRDDRQANTAANINFPFINSGYQKFEQFSRPL
jgi:hypothetical protein